LSSVSCASDYVAAMARPNMRLKLPGAHQ